MDLIKNEKIQPKIHLGFKYEKEQTGSENDFERNLKFCEDFLNETTEIQVLL